MRMPSLLWYVPFLSATGTSSQGITDLLALTNMSRALEGWDILSKYSFTLMLVLRGTRLNKHLSIRNSELHEGFKSEVLLQ